MRMASHKGGSSISSSMMLFAVLVGAMAIASVEAGVTKQQQQQELQPDHDNVDLRPHLPATFRTGFSRPIEPDHDNVDLRPHLPATFRTGFTRPIHNSPLVETSQIVLTDEEASYKPVKSGEKKKAFIKNASEKVSSQQHHSRSKRFLLPKQKYRVIAVPLSVFNFLGFLPIRIPGLPFHNDLPSPEYSPYRTTHEIPLRRRRKRLFKKY